MRWIAAIALLLTALMPHAAQAASAAQAQAVVERLAQQGLALAAPMPPEAREQRMRSLLAGAFDLPEIGRFVLGRHWQTASPAQRREFLDLFATLTVETWARRFADYDGRGLAITGVQPERGSHLVQSILDRRAGAPVAVTWRINDALKVTDIIVEGVSMAITYRQEYASVARSGGFDGLLAAMRQQLARVAD